MQLAKRKAAPQGLGGGVDSVALPNSATASAAELGCLFRLGAADPRAVTEAALARIAAHPDQAVFIRVTAERAEREAAASAARYAAGRPLGPLDGVPVAWKDLVDLEGEVTTAGSATRRDASPATADAPVAANLAASGMVCLGKLNLSEFAFSALGFNQHYGTPYNPCDPARPRAPGGSSSGSAVAVAAGLVAVAIGTDAGGSVRVPAALNGICGFKTSEGRVDKAGVFQLSETLDTVGPLARTVEDCALVERALRNLPACAPRPSEPATLTLLVPENVALEDCEPEVLARFEDALATLRTAGARIERRTLPMLDELVALERAHGSLVAAEAYRCNQAVVDGPDAARIDPRVLRRFLDGKRMAASDVLAIQAARTRLRRDAAALLDGALLAMPTVRLVAPPIEELEADPEHFLEVNRRASLNTRFGNLLDLCGLAIPAGYAAHGMPASLLLSAPAGHEDRLLAAGMTAQALLPHPMPLKVMDDAIQRLN